MYNIIPGESAASLEAVKYEALLRPGLGLSSLPNCYKPHNLCRKHTGQCRTLMLNQNHVIACKASVMNRSENRPIVSTSIALTDLKQYALQP